jgi:hypothetical protein
MTMVIGIGNQENGSHVLIKIQPCTVTVCTARLQLFRAAEDTVSVALRARVATPYICQVADLPYY